MVLVLRGFNVDISNLVSISRLDLVINLHNICTGLYPEKEFPLTIQNLFVYEYKEPVKISNISLSDLELETTETMRRDKTEPTILMGFCDNSKLKIGYNGTYYGLYDEHGHFSILALQDISITKQDDKYVLYLEFSDTHNVTFHASTEYTKTFSYKRLLSKKSFAEIQKERDQEWTSAMTSVMQDLAQDKEFQNNIEKVRKGFGI